MVADVTSEEVESVYLIAFDFVILHYALVKLDTSADNLDFRSTS